MSNSPLEKEGYMNEEERREFLKENPYLELLNEKEIEFWIGEANKVGENGEGYHLDYQKDGIMIESKKGENGILETRSIRHLKLHPSLLDYDHSLSYNDLIHQQKIVKMIDPNQWIYHCDVKSPFELLLSRRDFLYVVRFHQISEDSYVILLKSVEYKEFPPIPKVVRGIIYHTVFLIKPHPDVKGDSLILYLAKVDLKFGILDWIMNFIKMKMLPKVIRKMAKEMENYPKFLEEEKRKKNKNMEEVEEEEEKECVM